MIKIGVLCPDCGLEVISIERYNSGSACSSCLHRKSWAERKGVPYIKYKDLSVEEQNRLQQIRQYNQTFRDKRSRRNKKVTISNIIREPNKYNISKRKYPGGVYEFIKLNAGDNTSVRELYDALIVAYPELKDVYTLRDLSKYLCSRKLPFRRLTTEEKSQLILEGRGYEIKSNSKLNNSNNSVGKSNCVKNNDNLNTAIISNKIESTQDVYSEELRFAPIIAEVNSVLQKKFKKVGCNLEYDFKIEDYIDAFKVLRFLVKNFTDIVQKRNDQYDIANNYQTDVMHEMENEISVPGDTYFQDKCHVLRSVRRGYELDKVCIEIMKTFLFSLSKRTSELTDIIDKLEMQKNRKDTPKYVPNVDEQMIEKYEWAQSTNPSSTKLMQKQLLTTNSKANKRAGNPVFIASCYLSGGGYGTFKKWTKEVSYPTIEEAQRAVNLELDEIKRKNKNIMISEPQIYRKGF